MYNIVMTYELCQQRLAYSVKPTMIAPALVRLVGVGARGAGSSVQSEV